MPQPSAKRKGKGFFVEAPAREDEEARQREVAALLPSRRVVMQDLPIERIRPNPFQARRQFTNLGELSAAIQAQGFITRLRVRPDPEQPGYFQLAFGERRLRAARLARLTEVPCEVADHTDDELLEIGLAENIQRRDLEPLDEARAFHLFIDQRNYSIRRLAERIGKDKSYIEDRLALLRTPEDVQRMIEQRPDTLRIAREIAKLGTPEERQPLIEGVMAGKINTEDVRNIVRAVTSPAPLPATVGGGSPSAAIAENANIQAAPVEGASANSVAGVGGLHIEAPAWTRDALGHQTATTLGSAQASKEHKKPATSLQRDMGTVRVILARWHQSLPDMAAAERATLEAFIDEIEGACARLRIELGQMNGDTEGDQEQQ